MNKAASRKTIIRGAAYNTRNGELKNFTVIFIKVKRPPFRVQCGVCISPSTQKRSTSGSGQAPHRISLEMMTSIREDGDEVGEENGSDFRSTLKPACRVLVLVCFRFQIPDSCVQRRCECVPSRPVTRFSHLIAFAPSCATDRLHSESYTSEKSEKPASTSRFFRG